MYHDVNKKYVRTCVAILCVISCIFLLKLCRD